MSSEHEESSLKSIDITKLSINEKVELLQVLADDLRIQIHAGIYHDPIYSGSIKLATFNNKNRGSCQR